MASLPGTCKPCREKARDLRLVQNTTQHLRDEITELEEQLEKINQARLVEEQGRKEADAEVARLQQELSNMTVHNNAELKKRDDALDEIQEQLEIVQEQLRYEEQRNGGAQIPLAAGRSREDSMEM